MWFSGVSILFVYLDHLSHVTLRACVFSGVLHFDQDNKEKVMPHVVLLFDVLLESHRLVVKLVPLQACRGARSYRKFKTKTQLWVRDCDEQILN